MLTDISRNGFQNRFWRGVVAEGLADMREVVHIAGTEDKTSAKLQWIFAQFFLAMSSGFGTLTGKRVVFTEEV